MSDLRTTTIPFVEIFANDATVGRFAKRWTQDGAWPLGPNRPTDPAPRRWSHDDPTVLACMAEEAEGRPPLEVGDIVDICKPVLGALWDIHNHDKGRVDVPECAAGRSAEVLVVTKAGALVRLLPGALHDVFALDPACLTLRH